MGQYKGAKSAAKTEQNVLSVVQKPIGTETHVQTVLRPSIFVRSVIIRVLNVHSVKATIF